MGEENVKGVFSVNDGRIVRKIKAACGISGITVTELGRRMGMSQQSMSNRLKTGRFTKEELEKIADILGARYICFFEMDDGSII